MFVFCIEWTENNILYRFEFDISKLSNIVELLADTADIKSNGLLKGESKMTISTSATSNNSFIFYNSSISNIVTYSIASDNTIQSSQRRKFRKCCVDKRFSIFHLILNNFNGF